MWLAAWASILWILRRPWPIRASSWDALVTPLLRGGASHEVTPQGVHIYLVEPPRMDAYGFVSYVQHSNGLMEAAARIIADEYGRST